MKNRIFRRFNYSRAKKAFVTNLRDESMDFFLTNLLRLMDIYMYFDKNYRRNIENFNARYSFKSKDNKIDASVIFHDNEMEVKDYAIEDANVIVIFRDGLALKNFLFSESPDIIGAILNNEVSYKGNLNYLAKFAYMANHLKFKLTN